MAVTVVLLTKLPGLLPVKTRLVPVLGEAGARALYVRMVRETVALARTLDPHPVLAFSPPDGNPHSTLEGIEACGLLPTPGANGAACLEYALATAWRRRPLLALGGDAPDLPPERLRDAARALDAHDAAFVPTGDGGFSCLGLRAPVPGLASGFTYGAGDSLASLRAFLEAEGQSVTELAAWPDVDTPDDLEAWRRREVRRRRRRRPP